MEKLKSENIRFNPWKHHTGFIEKGIKIASKGLCHSLLLKSILSIGNNVLDLYTGNIEVAEIKQQTIDYLETIKADSPTGYKNWLHSEKYKEYYLSDGSKWIFRFGNTLPAFVHIHPGRNSLHNIRLKANALKTAIFISYCIQNEHVKNYPPNTEEINMIRKKYLDLSPVRRESGLRHIRFALDQIYSTHK
jgi:hypothetical protein